MTTSRHELPPLSQADQHVEARGLIEAIEEFSQRGRQDPRRTLALLETLSAAVDDEKHEIRALLL